MTYKQRLSLFILVDSSIVITAVLVEEIGIEFIGIGRGEIVRGTFKR